MRAIIAMVAVMTAIAAFDGSAATQYGKHLNAMYERLAATVADPMHRGN